MAMKNTTETCFGKTIHGDEVRCKFLNVRLLLTRFINRKN